MRRATVLVLAMALVVGFTLPALAADVKFTGDFYVRGYSVNNAAVVENTATGAGSLSSLTGRSLAGADSWFDQRLRVNMVATVSDKLSIISRFDIDEGEWGLPGGQPSGDRDGFASGFSVQRAFLRYTPLKELMFDVGHNGWEWNAGHSVAKNRKTQSDGITMYYKVGPGTLTLAYSKQNDCSDAGAARASGCARTSLDTVTLTGGTNVAAGQENDADRDYSTVQFDFKVGDVSLSPSITYDRSTLDQDVSISRLMPRLYGSAKAGAFNLKFEGAFDYGKAKCGRLPSAAGTTTTTFSSFQQNVAVCGTTTADPNIDVDIWSYVGYVEAGYQFGFGELGLQYIYASGDGNPQDTEAKAWASASHIGGTNDQASAIALRHQDETGLLWYRNGGYGAGSVNQGNNGIGTVSGARSGRGLTNAQVYGGYGKFKVAGGDLLANIFYAKANDVVMRNGTVLTAAQVAAGVSANQSKTYGTEVSATYYYPLLKELTLSASGGYLWAGDYFKGGAPGIELKDPWVLQWALTARF